MLDGAHQEELLKAPLASNFSSFLRLHVETEWLGGVWTCSNCATRDSCQCALSAPSIVLLFLGGIKPVGARHV